MPVVCEELPALGWGALFDNCIGRKRDVGGGVLAGLWRLGWVAARAAARRRGWGLKETTDGHVSRFIALEPMKRAGTS